MNARQTRWLHGAVEGRIECYAQYPESHCKNVGVVRVRDGRELMNRFSSHHTHVFRPRRSSVRDRELVQGLRHGTRPDDLVKKATREAVEKLGRKGYILGPGDTLDCLLEFGETTERDFHAVIEAWKECRSPG